MKFFLLTFFFISFLNAGEKVALLIGNTDYKFQPLSNPVNDVRAISRTLIEIGFHKKNVTVLENVSKVEIEKALYTFNQRAASAEIALIYFSGHGMQVNNKNYMFPARTTATKPVDLFGLVDLNYFIQSASSAKYGIILVDACRTNPLVKYFQNQQYNTNGKNIKKGTKGLGQIDTKQNKGEFIIGFATSIGNTADDGVGKTSPYAKALVKNIKKDLEIRKVLGEVGKDVQKEYPHQNPIVKFTLGKEDVCLTGECKNSSTTIQSNTGIIINGGTFYKGVSNHIGDIHYNTPIKVNIKEKDKK